MKNYRYTPFNVLSGILGFISLNFLLIILYKAEINGIFKVLFSLTFLNPLFPILLWIIDYHFQKKKN